MSRPPYYSDIKRMSVNNSLTKSCLNAAALNILLFAECEDKTTLNFLLNNLRQVKRQLERGVVRMTPSQIKMVLNAINYYEGFVMHSVVRDVSHKDAYPTRMFNSAKAIVDQILWRMAALERFSDDDDIIGINALVPLDVISHVDNDGETWLGLVLRTEGCDEFAVAKAYCRNQSGDSENLYFLTGEQTVRTINELEAKEARLSLMQLFTTGERV